VGSLQHQSSLSCLVEKVKAHSLYYAFAKRVFLTNRLLPLILARKLVKIRGENDR
jgi:hypothetical protein